MKEHPLFEWSSYWRSRESGAFGRLDFSNPISRKYGFETLNLFFSLFWEKAEQLLRNKMNVKWLSVFFGHSSRVHFLDMINYCLHFQDCVVRFFYSSLQWHIDDVIGMNEVSSIDQYYTILPSSGSQQSCPLCKEINNLNKDSDLQMRLSWRTKI